MDASNCSLPDQSDYCSMLDYDSLHYPEEIATNTVPTQGPPFGVQLPASKSEAKIFSQTCCENSLDFSDPLIPNLGNPPYPTGNPSTWMINLPIPHAGSTNNPCSLSNGDYNTAQLPAESSSLYINAGNLTNFSPPSPSPATSNSDADSVFVNDSDSTSLNNDNDKIEIPDWSSSVVVNIFDGNVHSKYPLPEELYGHTKKQKKGKKRSRCFIPRSLKPVIIALFEEYYKADNTRTVNDIANQIFHDDLKPNFE